MSKKRDGWQDAARTALVRWHRFQQSANPVEQAHELVALNDAMHDLMTWLPGYDYEHPESVLWEEAANE